MSSLFKQPFGTNKRLLNILFWPLFGLYTYTVFYLYRGPVYALGVILVDLPIQFTFAHVYLKWVIPAWREGRFLRFFSFTFLMVAASVVIGRSLFYLFARTYIPEVLINRDMFSFKELIGAPFDYITVPVLFILIRTLQSSFLVSLQNQRLVTARKEAELKLLKAQINPHFLFNTLNSLYGLCLANSRNAADSVFHLSRIMEYMLFESNKESIALQKEIEYIENYIALEQLRYGHRVNLSLNITIPLEKRGMPIAPLILLPFLENAFKHGVSNQSDEVWIMVHLSMTQEKLKYIVTNTFKQSVKAAESANNSGLSILIQRLEHIYPNRYFIETGKEEERFIAKLEIYY